MEKYKINMDEVDGRLDSFSTFNDFFARKLRMEFRPIASPEDDTVLVSPADCRMAAFSSVDKATRFWVKGKDFTLGSLLGRRFSCNAADYERSALVIARLAPQDYHRWHMPVAGRMVSLSAIDGTFYTVNPVAVNSRTNVFTANKRVVCEIESPSYGRVFLVAIGATCVGSIVIFDPEGARVELPFEPDEEKHIECDFSYKKGDNHGEFRFGGSTIILALQEGRAALDEDLLRHSQSDDPIECYVRARTRIGTVLNETECFVFISIKRKRWRTCARKSAFPRRAKS